MEGFEFNIRYTPKRNRLHTLRTPFVLIMLFVLLSSFGFKYQITHHAPHAAHHDHVRPTPKSTSVQDGVSVQVRQSLHEQLILQHPSQRQIALHQPSSFIDRFIHGLHHSSMPVILLLLTGFTLTAITLMIIGVSGRHFLFAPLLLTLLFRKKYPTWWYQWNLHASRFYARIIAYTFFVVPNIPSLEECDHITLNIPNPKDQDLSRFLPLIKWLLALPHSILLLFFMLLALIINLFVFPYLLITAHYPKPLFDFMEGLMRWLMRVSCYNFLLCTDTYPKFSFKP